MEHVTDWALLWREVVEARTAGRDADDADEGAEAVGGRFRRGATEPEAQAQAGPGDRWAGRAREFDSMAQARPRGAGSRQQAVLDLLESGDSLLDIGAGTGAWEPLFAAKVAAVTALEVSPSMAEVLRENVAAAPPETAARIRIVEGRWPDAPVGSHDVSFCAHAMYWAPDLPAFIHEMEAVTRRRCFLVIRLPAPDGLLGQVAQRVWGHPFDSPNFVIAYNVLIQMGITANVRIDAGSQLRPRTSATIEEALGRIHRHFGLGDRTEHDDWIRELLARRLVPEDGRPDAPLVWPREGGGALVWWDVAR